VLDQALRLLHPFMPFLTEELWQGILPRKGKLLAGALFPLEMDAVGRQQFEKAHGRVEMATALTEKLRQIRMETGVPLSAILERVGVYSGDPSIPAEVDRLAGYVQSLAKVKGLKMNDAALRSEKGIALGMTRFRDLTVVVDLKGLVDLAKEKQRQEKELARLENGLQITRRQLGQADFMAKAPPEMVEEKRSAEADYLKKIQEVKQALELL